MSITEVAKTAGTALARRTSTTVGFSMLMWGIVIPSCLLFSHGAPQVFSSEQEGKDMVERTVRDILLQAHIRIARPSGGSLTESIKAKEAENEQCGSLW